MFRTFTLVFSGVCVCVCVCVYVCVFNAQYCCLHWFLDVVISGHVVRVFFNCFSMVPFAPILTGAALVLNSKRAALLL
jgi:hypothetical protein